MCPLSARFLLPRRLCTAAVQRKSLVLYRKRESASSTQERSVFARFRYNDLKEDAGGCGGCAARRRAHDTGSYRRKTVSMRAFGSNSWLVGHLLGASRFIPMSIHA